MSFYLDWTTQLAGWFRTGDGLGLPSQGWPVQARARQSLALADPYGTLPGPLRGPYGTLTGPLGTPKGVPCRVPLRLNRA